MSQSDNDADDDMFEDSDEGFDENLNYVIPRPWKSETEEATNSEILASYIDLGRSKITLEFGKQRKQFGKKLTLNDRDATDSLHYIGAFHDPQYNYQIKKRVNDMGLQASNQMVENSTQTAWNKKINKAVQTSTEKYYLEIEDDNSEQVQFMQKAYVFMEESLTSNETINIFSDDFNQTAEDDGDRQGGATELSIIKEIKSFEFEECKNKLISCIQFQPKQPSNTHNIVATSFIENLNFDERIEVCGRSYKNEILFWDYEDMHLFVPVLVLISPLEILTFEFKPNDPNILIAGAINGQIMLWNLQGKLVKKDTTTKSKQRKNKDDKNETPAIPPMIMSTLQEPFNIAPVVPMEIYSRKIVNSHKNHIVSLKFLPPRVELDKKNPLNLTPKPEGSVDYNFFLTTSCDGQILFWDTRFENKDSKKISAGANVNQPDYNVAWKGVLSVQLYRPEGGVMGISQINFQPKNTEKTHFYGTSDEGDLFFADWCAKPTDESNKIEVIQRCWSTERSGRPTVAQDTSPFFDDIILSIYDCYFTLWKYDCDDPIFISPTIKNTFITSGFFSPSRPGVIYIGRADGFLDIWDFIDQSNAPTQQHLVVAIGIHSMRINPHKPHLLAAGDRDGCLHMLELPKNLTRKVQNEESVISDFYGREQTRVDYFKDRFEIRQEQYRKFIEEKEQAGEGGKEFATMVRKDDDKVKTEDEHMEDAYQEFLTEFFEGKKEKEEEKDPKGKKK